GTKAAQGAAGADQDQRQRQRPAGAEPGDQKRSEHRRSGEEQDRQPEECADRLLVQGQGTMDGRNQWRNRKQREAQAVPRQPEQEEPAGGAAQARAAPMAFRASGFSSAVRSPGSRPR